MAILVIMTWQENKPFMHGNVGKYNQIFDILYFD